MTSTDKLTLRQENALKLARALSEEDINDYVMEVSVQQLESTR
jgi:hypothetical protein